MITEIEVKEILKREFPEMDVKGFISASYSIGYNLAITPSVLFRVEGKYFQSPDKVFTHGNSNTDNHTVITED